MAGVVLESKPTPCALKSSRWKFAPRKCLISDSFGICGVGASRSIIATTNVPCGSAMEPVRLIPNIGGMAVSVHRQCIIHLKLRKAMRSACAPLRGSCTPAFTSTSGPEDCGKATSSNSVGSKVMFAAFETYNDKTKISIIE